MYVPPAFAETDLTTLFDFIERYSFGQLVSQLDGLPFASHLPFLLERDAKPCGTLVGHMSRANPQWRQLAGQTALCIFAGPHVYVSPTWYESEHVVPTWNYTAVHAFGRVELVEDLSGLLEIVERSVQVYEKSVPWPWTLDGSGTFAQRMLTQIVGFRIQVEKLEGKWKLNQNHPAERRERVVQALSQRGDENSLAIAEMMTRLATREG
jgi:transcriptional regulator